MYKYLQKELCDNKYLMDEVLWETIAGMVDGFTHQIMNENTCNFKVPDKISILGFIQEIYSISYRKEELLEKGFEITENLRNEIEKGKIKNMALYGGLCNIGMFLHGLEKETGYFTKFLDSLDKYIVEIIINYCRTYSMNLQYNTFTNYDTISGMSGVAAYLLQRKSENNRNGILEIIKYFQILAKERICKDLIVPGWYVSRENLPTMDYREDYKRGCVNFSLSHGIAGPLFVLAKSCKEGIETPGQKEAIELILKEYERFSWYDNGIWYAPGILSLDEYQQSGNRENTRMSWCYGGIGALNSLLMAAKAVNDPDREMHYERIIGQMAQVSMEIMGLESPILCHGYAGTAAIFRNLYEYSNAQEVLEQCHRIVKRLTEIHNTQYKWGFQDIIRKKKESGITAERFDRLNFLEGACGIYCELTVYLKKKNSYYDNSLLLK